MEAKKSWGGARKGAGRKPSHKVSVTLYVRIEDLEKLKKLSEKERVSYGEILSMLLASKAL